MVDLSIPVEVTLATAALRQDLFYILRPRLTSDASGTSPDPDGPERIGGFDCEFWAVRGDELAPEITEARGHYRLAMAKELPSGVTVEETDQVEVNGRVYDVAWNPEPSGLDLTRVIGLED